MSSNTYYNRRLAYEPMTDYVFQDGDFGNIAAHLLSYTPQYITPIEQSILGKILSRAVRFSKDNVLMPIKDLTHGVTSSKGVVYDTPSHSAKTTIERAIKSLVDKGLIKYILDTVSYPYVNRVIVYVRKIKEILGMGKLKIGKKQRNSGTQNESEGVTQNESTNRYNNNRGNKDKDLKNSNSSSIEGIRLSVEKVKEKSRVRRKETISTRSSFSGSAFARLWNAAFADYAEKHNILATKLTQLETGMAGKSFKNNPMFTRGDWNLYLIDVLTYWNEYAHHLTKRSKHRVPEYPNFQYFSKHRNRFQAVYQEERTGKVLVIGSEAHKIDQLTKANEKLRSRVDGLQQENKLQSIAKHDNYLDKIIRNGGVVRSRSKTQQKLALNPTDVFAEKNW